MKNKHPNSLLLWLLPAAAVMCILYKIAASSHTSPTAVTQVTCSLPDGSLLPIRQDSMFVRELYEMVPAKMRDTTRDADAAINIQVPATCRFKLMLNVHSTVFLNGESTFYIPMNGGLHHTMAVQGEAFFDLKEEDTSSSYRIVAGPLADIGASQGKFYIRSTDDSCTLAMLTAKAKLKAFEADTIVSPGRGVCMTNRVPKGNWTWAPVDPTYTPAFAVESMRFIKAPFLKVAHFLEDYYHVEVMVENEYLNFRLVTADLQAGKLSLERSCDVIHQATGYDWEITEGSVTFSLRPFLPL